MTPVCELRDYVLSMVAEKGHPLSVSASVSASVVPLAASGVPLAASGMPVAASGDAFSR